MLEYIQILAHYFFILFVRMFFPKKRYYYVIKLISLIFESIFLILSFIPGYRLGGGYWGYCKKMIPLFSDIIRSYLLTFP